MTGKEKCELLRGIRRRIAEENRIDLPNYPCTYQGEDCVGTCDLCEMELAYLQAELDSRAAMGDTLALGDLKLDELVFESRDADSERIPVEALPQTSPEQMALPVRNLPLPDSILNKLLNRGVVLTVGQMLHLVAQELQRRCDLTDEEMEIIADLLGEMGLRLRRRPDRREVRGMMRGPRWSSR